MARNFLGFPFAPYKGIYSSKAFNSSSGRPKGLMIALDILWPLYLANGAILGNNNPNFSVNVNLNAAGPNSVSQSWTIQSVYIDNEAVDFPVYVYFNDTFFTVSCPANSAGWYQVFTNGRQAIVAGVGISDSSITASQRTRVFFTDAQMVPNLDEEQPSSIALWLGSPTIQRSNLSQPGYGTPALGDQTTNLNLSMASTGNTTLILPTLSSGFYYLTHFQAWGSGIESNPGPGFCRVEITVGATLLFAFPMIAPALAAFTAGTQVVQPIAGPLNGMQIKFSAAQAFAATVALGTTSGGFEAIFGYSFSNK